MKKNFLIILFIFVAILLIDSIMYTINYKKTIDLVLETNEIYGYDESIPPHMDVFSKFYDYFRDGFATVIQFIYPIILIFIGCADFHQTVHSGFLKGVISRTNYSKFCLKQVLNSWKCSIFIPVVMIIAFIFSIIVTKANFDLSYVNNYNLSIGNNIYKTVHGELLNVLIMAINLTIISIACINVGNIFIKKNSNFWIASILSYLFIIAYQLIVAIIIGPILTDAFDDVFFINGMTLFCFWYYDTGVTPLKMFIYASILVIISTIFVMQTFKNKEEVIIYAEK